MIKIVADENIPFLRGVLEPWCRMEYLPGHAIRQEHLKDADGLIIRTRTKCNESLLEGSGVRFIATATIGYDHIDTEYCKKRGIAWFHAAGCNSSSVIQYAASCLAELAGRKGLDLRNKVIGIIGVGNVGTKMISLAEVLGMRVLQNDPPRERKEGKGGFVHLSEVLAAADIISIHVPLIRAGEDRTLYLADKAFFSKMKHGAILINTSRGPVIDEAALKSQILAKKLKATALDVWDNEPGIDTTLMNIVDIATPHIAGYSLEGKANGTAYCVNEASRFFGFGADRWYPDPLPAPPRPAINIDPQGKESLSIVYQAFSKTYDINRDDRMLRTNPGLFEGLRTDYPIRREFPAYTIHLSAHHQKAEGILKRLGFSVRVG